MTYRDAADRPFTFTVLYGKVVPIEKRQYLTCQCVESEGNNDVPGLEHNWFLRLDRIQNAIDRSDSIIQAQRITLIQDRADTLAIVD